MSEAVVSGLLQSGANSSFTLGTVGNVQSALENESSWWNLAWAADFIVIVSGLCFTYLCPVDLCLSRWAG